MFHKDCYLEFVQISANNGNKRRNLMWYKILHNEVYLPLHIYTKSQILFLPPMGFEPRSLGTVSRWLIHNAMVPHLKKITALKTEESFSPEDTLAQKEATIFLRPFLVASKIQSRTREWAWPDLDSRQARGMTRPIYHSWLSPNRKVGEIRCILDLLKYILFRSQSETCQLSMKRL